MRNFLFFLAFTCLSGVFSCSSAGPENSTEDPGSKPEMVKHHREDGSLSSVSSVDEDGYVHGIWVKYYEDGKTVHSKVSYQHGRKHGPAIWYYKSGQIFEHTNFYFGRKDGLTRKYYESGNLMEEFSYLKGEVLPGKKRYRKDGTLRPD